jgi:nucleoside 2-deoxyribosyltransferase
MSKQINVLNHSCNSEASIYTVISGSFRKHLSHIIILKRALEEHKICVLSPSGNYALNPEDEFIFLDSDIINHPRVLQDSVFAKIRRSSFLVVANINEYLGKAAIMEIGYAIALGIPIYSLFPIKDPNLEPYCSLLTDIIPSLKKIL